MLTSSQLLEKINAYMEELKYSRKPEGLYTPIKYVLSLGGKRIRPVLMLMAYNLYKEKVDDILSSAAAIEMYHNYTLLHDDLMDKADMRRNKPTVHKVWGSNTAILSGDTMLVLAYQLMSQNTSHLKEVLSLFSETALEIGEGQQFDMEFETRNDVNEDEYIEMIRLKTSVLLAASLKIGAILADAPGTECDKLYDLGVRVGLAFQLQDDYLDVYGNPAVFGKNIGGDILCNKKTYMLINAFQKADRTQKESLEHWINNATEYNPQEKISAVTDLYNAIGIKEMCQQRIESYFQQGMSCLEQLQLPDEHKQPLRFFVESLMHRNV